MNKFLPVSIIIAIGVIISVSFLLEDNETPKTIPVYESGFTYYDIETIQTVLAEEDISVSVPSAITDHTIDQYCTFFEDGRSQTVKYCTTTAVLDSEGNPLGNINIGGDTVSPVMAVANLETRDLNTNRDKVFMVFETMIETLVCDCWDEKDTQGYESISSWLEAVHTFHSDSDGRNIKSKIENLDNHKVILEITTKEDSILQTLVILK